jgi:hypothetical protein
MQTVNIPVFFTSIIDGGNQDLIIGTQLILEKFSDFYSSFNDQVMPLLQQFDFHPLLMSDKNNRIVANFILDEGEFQQIKQYYLALLQVQEGGLQEPLNFLATWLKEKNLWLFCINLAQFYPDLKNLLFKADTIDNISEFHSAYQKLLDTLRWSTENIDLNES